MRLQRIRNELSSKEMMLQNAEKQVRELRERLPEVMEGKCGGICGKPVCSTAALYMPFLRHLRLCIAPVPCVSFVRSTPLMRYSFHSQQARSLSCACAWRSLSEVWAPLRLLIASPRLLDYEVPDFARTVDLPPIFFGALCVHFPPRQARACSFHHLRCLIRDA